MASEKILGMGPRPKVERFTSDGGGIWSLSNRRKGSKAGKASRQVCGRNLRDF